MKRGYVVLLPVVLCVLLFASGCTDNNQNATKDNPFIGGTTGLLIKYAENNPPAEVVDGGSSPFDIVVSLENSGEYDVPKDKVEVRISGLSPTDFGKTSADFRKNPPDDLTSMKKDSEGNKQPGAVSFVEFTDLNYVSKLPGNMPFIVRADVCYKYGTRAVGLFCARRDLMSTRPGVCTVVGSKDLFASSGPIQVTSFEESVSGSSKVTFNFRLQQKGNGEVFKKDTNCDTAFANLNKVFVSVSTGIAGLKCQSLSEKVDDTSGYVRLSNGEAAFTCTQETGDTDFQGPANLLLEYDYSESATAHIIVKHLPE